MHVLYVPCYYNEERPVAIESLARVVINPDIGMVSDRLMLHPPTELNSVELATNVNLNTPTFMTCSWECAMLFCGPKLRTDVLFTHVDLGPCSSLPVQNKLAVSRVTADVGACRQPTGAMAATGMNSTTQSSDSWF